MKKKVEQCRVEVFNRLTINRNVDWNNWYLLTWMRLISIYSPTTNSSHNVLTIISLFIRYGLWMLNLVANGTQIVLFYKDDYSGSTSTEYWNTVIDYWNWTFHNISIHSYIIFLALREKQWPKLTNILIKNNHRMQSLQLSTGSKKIKYLNIFGILYIILAVR